LLSFHADNLVKTKYLKIALDQKNQIIKGQEWTLNSWMRSEPTIYASEHVYYEKDLGIPDWLVRIKYHILEGLKVERSRTWPIEFLQATPVGANLNQLKDGIIIFSIQRVLQKFDQKKYFDVAKSIGSVIDIFNLSEDRKYELNKTWDELNTLLMHHKDPSKAAVRAAMRTAQWACSSTWGTFNAWAEWMVWAATRAASSAGSTASGTLEYDLFANKIIELLSNCPVVDYK